MTKKIIIQGDDLGYNSQTDKGILHAYGYGILTSTTVMANLLTVEDKTRYRELINNLQNKSRLQKPKLSIGVHLNVTYGKPLSKNWKGPFDRPLRGSDKKEEWQGSTWTKYFSQFSEKQVEEEYRLQIEMAMDIFDEIDHLDSHHYTASYEPFKTVYEKLAREYKLAVRAAAPLSEKSVYGGDFNYKKEYSQNLKTKGIRTADNYLLTLFFNEDDPVESFLKAVSEIKDETTEIMFHPAMGDGTDKWRLTDLGILTDEMVLRYFEESDIELIGYGDIK